MNSSRIKAVVVVFCILVSLQTANAEPTEVREGRISAAVLYYLALYTDWPAESLSATDTLNVCISGQSALNRYIVDTVRGKKVHQKKFAVFFVSKISDAANCHMIFMGKGSMYQPKVAGTRVLTVSDSFASNAMITLFERKNKFNLRVNLCRVGKTPLELRKALLTVASVTNDCCSRV